MHWCAWIYHGEVWARWLEKEKKETRKCFFSFSNRKSFFAFSGSNAGNVSVSLLLTAVATINSAGIAPLESKCKACVCTLFWTTSARFLRSQRSFAGHSKTTSNILSDWFSFTYFPRPGSDRRTAHWLTFFWTATLSLSLNPVKFILSVCGNILLHLFIPKQLARGVFEWWLLLLLVTVV